METAVQELGVAEIPGEANNPRIIEYLKTVMRGSLADEISWCSAFANWVLEQHGLRGTNSPLARSFFHCDSSTFFELSHPKYGALVVMRRGKEPWMGHVGFFVQTDPTDPNYFYMLGGNQGNSVSIARFPYTPVLGYRWPVYVIRGIKHEIRKGRHEAGLG